MRNLMAIFVTTIGIALSAPVLAATVVTVSPGVGPPTQTVTVAGSGFGASEAVDVYIDTVDTLLVVSTATGTFSVPTTIPAAAQPGNHYVTAIGRKSGDAAQAAFDVYTAWLESGFGAAHLAWNQYENTLSPGVVPQLEHLWSTVIGNGFGSPVLNFGKLFVGSASGSGLFALNATTGAAYWNKGVGSQFYGSPAVSAATGGVYLSSYAGVMYDFNQGTGAITWSTTLVPACFGSSTIVGSVLYTECGNNVYALNASTGSVLWTFATGGVLQGEPAVVNGIVYVGSNDDSVYALNAATGAKIWSFATGNDVVASPAVANGIVYIGSDDFKFYALNAATGALKWSVATGSNIEGSAAVAGGVVYVGSEDGTLYAFNAATGTIEWTYSLGIAITGNASVADGVVYVGDDGGNVYAVNAYYGGYLANVATGSYITSTPEVVNGLLYVTSNDGTVYAYEAGGSGANAIRAAKPPAESSLHPNMSLVPVASK